jgi:hypothetical protein
MKKWTLLLTVMLLLLVNVAGAEKVKFKDNQFNFTNYSDAHISSINILNVDQDSFISDQGSESKMILLLRQAFGDRKVTLNADKEATVPASDQPYLKSVPQIAITVYCLGYDKIFHGPWDETVSTTKTITTWDNKGHATYIDIPVTELVHHPAGYYYNAKVDIQFDVTDPRTGKNIYTVRDSRGRGGETDTSGMLKRICNDFAEDMTKN